MARSQAVSMALYLDSLATDHLFHHPKSRHYTPQHITCHYHHSIWRGLRGINNIYVPNGFDLSHPMLFFRTSPDLIECWDYSRLKNVRQTKQVTNILWCSMNLNECLSSGSMIVRILAWVPVSYLVSYQLNWPKWYRVYLLYPCQNMSSCANVTNDQVPVETASLLGLRLHFVQRNQSFGQKGDFDHWRSMQPGSFSMAQESGFQQGEGQTAFFLLCSIAGPKRRRRTMPIASYPPSFSHNMFLCLSTCKGHCLFKATWRLGGLLSVC